MCGFVVLSFRQVRNRTAAIGPSVSGVSPDRTSSPATTGNTRALNLSAARSASAASPAPIISPSTWNVTYPKAPNAKKTNKRITTTVLYSRTHYNEVSDVVGRRRPLNHHIIWLSPPPEYEPNSSNEKKKTQKPTIISTFFRRNDRDCEDLKKKTRRLKFRYIFIISFLELYRNQLAISVCVCINYILYPADLVCCIFVCILSLSHILACETSIRLWHKEPTQPKRGASQNNHIK